MPGKLFTWGQALNGLLANGTTTPDVLTPTQIGSDDWDAIYAGNFHVFAIKSGELWAWGSNGSGRLGDGTTTQRNSPVRIGNDSDWELAAAGANFSAGIKNGGELWAWGNNSSGNVGDGTTTERNSPVRIGNDSDWEQVSASDVHCLAIKNGGELWAWGSGLFGAIGDGTTTQRNSPVQIGNDSNWDFVYTGRYHSLAIKNGGEFWAWGANGARQLGDGTTTQRNSPVRIGNDSNWEQLSGGKSQGYSLGLKNGGQLWGWGWNASGNLGDGTTTNRNSPVRIGNDSGWQTIATGNEISCGIRNGNLYTWGSSTNGSLGNGTTTPDVHVPTQIGISDQWENVIAMIRAGAAIQTSLVAPINTAAPSVSGTAKVGETLTTTDGTWTGNPTPTYTYQWKSADTSDGSYSNISGATSSSFTLTSSEAGKYIKAEVTATNSEGAVAQLSSATSQIVQDVANTALPTILTTDDVLQVGSLMTSTDGTWDGFPAPTYGYQWQVSNDGSTGWANISGATSSTITLQSAQGGKYVRLEVTATNSENSVTASSTSSAFISEDPASVSAPTVSGTPNINETLSADPGTWSGFPSPIAFSYQWQRSADGSTNWQTISGATTSTYLLGEADVNKFVRVTVQASNDAGEAVASSEGLGPILGSGGSNSTAAIIGALSVSGAI